MRLSEQMLAFKLDGPKYLKYSGTMSDAIVRLETDLRDNILRGLCRTISITLGQHERYAASSGEITG